MPVKETRFEPALIAPILEFDPRIELQTRLKRSPEVRNFLHLSSKNLDSIGHNFQVHIYRSNKGQIRSGCRFQMIEIFRTSLSGSRKELVRCDLHIRKEWIP